MVLLLYHYDRGVFVSVLGAAEGRAPQDPTLPGRRRLPAALSQEVSPAALWV